MGGKEIKNTRRYETVEFLQLYGDLYPIIGNLFNCSVYLIKYFHDKETHGDMDLLLERNTYNSTHFKYMQKIIREHFKPEQFFISDTICMFNYNDFQIDLIPISSQIWDVATCYYDYDPTGNLMGKIAHKFGLKYGFDGLIYPYRSDMNAHNIVISRDNEKIFEFLGYDYNRFKKGFDSLENIFEFIIFSKYFDVDSFRMENLTRIDRKRNQKRESYQLFLEYVATKQLKTKYEL